MHSWHEGKSGGGVGGSAASETEGKSTEVQRINIFVCLLHAEYGLAH